jgi:hypothetical protein
VEALTTGLINSHETAECHDFYPSASTRDVALLSASRTFPKVVLLTNIRTIARVEGTRSIPLAQGSTGGWSAHARKQLRVLADHMSCRIRGTRPTCFFGSSQPTRTTFMSTPVQLFHLSGPITSLTVMPLKIPHTTALDSAALRAISLSHNRANETAIVCPAGNRRFHAF